MAVSIHRCRRRSAPVRSGAPQFALRASAVVDYEAWTCRNRVITLKFIIWFHLKCFRRTKHGNDIWYHENVLTYTITFKFCVLFQENVLSYTKSSTRDNYGDRCIAPGLSITIFFLGGVGQISQICPLLFSRVLTSLLRCERLVETLTAERLVDILLAENHQLVTLRKTM